MLTPADGFIQGATTGDFTDNSAMLGITSLWEQSTGDSNVCVAVLDGPVDQSHPCFDGADLTVLQTLVSNEVGSGQMSAHGTHIASVIFGQHGSPVYGIAPRCRGLIVPIFADSSRGFLSQLDLARAINQAVEQGAHIINISGGQLTEVAAADPMLVKAVNFCQENGVLIVAAAGNDGCQCLHVPAALPSVLAVGAVNTKGLPFDFSNWGEAYQTQGILAPGENILGAIPGGGTALKSGTSFATPIVSGIAALLLSIQIQRGEQPNPYAIREAILNSAFPCHPETVSDCRRFLVGSLNIPGSYALITKGGTSQVLEETTDLASSTEQISDIGAIAAEATTVQTLKPAITITPNSVLTASVTPSGVSASENCGCNGGGNVTAITPSNATSSLIYALGIISYDFGTEARRDTFKQSMPPVEGNPPFPANPYVVSQMVNYLEQNPYESKSLIWILNIEVTPVYAIEPGGPYAEEVYQQLVSALKGQIKPEDDNDFVSRVSIPGVLTGKTVKLFSGQVVPVIAPEIRGISEWNVNRLVTAAVSAATAATPSGQAATPEAARTSLKEFLNRVYYEFRNLGQTSQERSLNYAATNAFQAAQALSVPTSQGMQLDTIVAEKSPFCRQDSDCWDIKLKFFDPENDNRARKIIRFTVDVSDVIPVTIGDVRTWSAPN